MIVVCCPQEAGKCTRIDLPEVLHGFWILCISIVITSCFFPELQRIEERGSHGDLKYESYFHPPEGPQGNSHQTGRKARQQLTGQRNHRQGSHKQAAQAPQAEKVWRETCSCRSCQSQLWKAQTVWRWTCSGGAESGKSVAGIFTLKSGWIGWECSR